MVDRYDAVTLFEKTAIGGYVAREFSPQVKVVLAADYEALEAEKEGWMETAAQHLRNEDYYHGLVQGIGKHFGADAYISEDGSIQQDVLCAKVPYLVMRMNERLWELEVQLAAADKGLLKASDPNSGWQGINKECKLCQEKAEGLEAKLAAAAERINELQKELDENRTTHSMNLAEKLRLSQKRNKALESKLARLVEKVDQAEKWLSGGGDKVHVSIMLKAALAS